MNILGKYKIKGMHCASCAVNIERTFKNIEGVESAEVNYVTETAKVSFDKSKITLEFLSKKIEPLGYSLDMDMSEDDSFNTISPDHSMHLGFGQSNSGKLKELVEMKSKIMSAIPVAIVAIVAMSWDILAKIKVISEMSPTLVSLFSNLLPILATYILVVIGKPYLLGLYRFLKYGKANMDTLVGLGTFTAYLYSFTVNAFEEVLRPFINVDVTYYDVTIIVIVFVVFGKYLENKSKFKTGDAIEKLLNLQAKSAFVIRNGKEIEISIKAVLKGDLIVIKPGARIPVDGVVVSGMSYVDESMVTGESMPVHKKKEASVMAGTMNTNGSFVFKTTKVGSETLLARIINMVKNAQSSKAPIEKLTDKISAQFVPIVLVIAFISFILWILIGTSYFGFSQALSYAMVSFVAVLVIACPCALGLATPTAIIVGVGKGAKEGILVKDATTLEKLYKVDTVVMDKTGTLTKGKPSLVDIQNFSDFSDEELISILASLEEKSEHPIARAILAYAKEKNIKTKNVVDFKNLEGKGIKGIIPTSEILLDESSNKDIIYYAGSLKLISELGIAFDSLRIEKFTKEGKTPVILAMKEKENGFVLGIVMVADEVKKESKEAIRNLHKLGIRVIMLTGDEEQTAKYIASLVGIDEVIAHLLPENKLREIKNLQEKGAIVALAGDGINDAPALAQADVGIAMSTGTDVAIETAGITLLNGDISRLVKAIKLSKMTMRGIKQNLFFAFIYNIIGIPLASGIFFPFFGWLLSPVFAGFAMAISSISVVGNSLRIKSKKL